MAPSQLTADGQLRHLLTLDGLPLAIIHRIFERANRFAAGDRPRLLTGRLLVNLFYETSTRTRTAFEASAKQLGADVVNLDCIRMAGEVKSESLSDTIKTIGAMGASGVILRHSFDGAATVAATAAPPGLAVVNGGDGCHAHPSQGLTDAYTLHKCGYDFSPLSVAIVGDVLHSRVARTNIHILRTLGVTDIRLVGPPALCPPTLATQLGQPVINDMDTGIANCQVIMLLRIQKERLSKAIPASDESAQQRYFDSFGMSKKRLAQLKKEVVIMHPGPINRGVEIDDAVADSEQSLILKQVTNGMFMRMAILSELLS